MMSTTPAILFDLDGTLLDTAPDMAYALNQQRSQHHLPELTLPVIRPFVGYGSRALLKLAFDIDENHPRYAALLEEFLMLYQANLVRSTQLFPDMDTVLQYLENHSIPWGIVTNKPSRFTYDLLKTLKIDQRTSCIVCGDSLSRRKPHPDTILHACATLRQEPKNCVYVGDNAIDVVASKAAGTQSLVALYGYISETDDPFSWKADGYIHHPLAIIDWLRR